MDPQIQIDTTVAHSARRYDYWLGGKDNYAADRASGDAIAAAFPSAPIAAQENRAFMHRVAGYLAAEAGIKQFLDIGTGIPTSPNLHEITQRVTPDARVVYVDNDPIVLTYARALLTGTPQGRTAYLDADLRDPDAILGSAEVAEVLDLGQPVALSLIAVAHFFADDQDPFGIVRRLVDAVPSGSYLAMSHATVDLMPPDVAARFLAATAGQGSTRSKDEFARFFEGLELVDPGITVVSEWRDGRDERPDPADVCGFGAVARIP